MLGLRPHPGAVEELLAALDDVESTVRHNVVDALGRIGDARSVGALVPALADASPSVRFAASRALDRIDPEWAGSDAARRAVPTVIEILDSGGKRGPAAAEALGKLKGPLAIEALARALTHEDHMTQWYATRALEEIGGPEVVDPFLSALRSDDGVLRMTAGDALARLGEPAVGPLLELLGDSDATVRAAAMEALGGTASARAYEPLVAALEQEEPAMRWAAARRLGRLGDARAFDPLLRLLATGSASARRAAASALGNLGCPHAFDALVPLLGSDNEGLQAAAAGALGRLGDPRAVEPLIRVLETGPPETRELAAVSLGRLADARARTPLLAALADTAPEIRRAAAGALGSVGGEGVEEALTQALSDGDDEVIELARESLERLRQERRPRAAAPSARLRDPFHFGSPFLVGAGLCTLAVPGGAKLPPERRATLFVHLDSAGASASTAAKVLQMVLDSGAAADMAFSHLENVLGRARRLLEPELAPDRFDALALSLEAMQAWAFCHAACFELDRAGLPGEDPEPPSDLLDLALDLVFTGAECLSYSKSLAEVKGYISMHLETAAVHEAALGIGSAFPSLARGVRACQDHRQLAPFEGRIIKTFQNAFTGLCAG